MSQEVGELFESRGEVSIEWIVDIHSLPEDEDEECTSPVFSLSDSCWCLGIESNNKDDICVFLRREDWGPAKTVSFDLGYISRYDEKKYLCLDNNYSFSKNDVIETYAVSKALLVPSPSEKLVVICNLRSNEKQSLEVSLFRRLWSASLSSRKILDETESDDLVLKLKNGESSAHRMLLESRFHDFVLKMDDEMKRSETGELEQDIEDKDVFMIILRYMFSGEPDGLSSKNVGSVYRNALKYDLHELMKLCTLLMEKNLCVDGVCETIAFADLCKEQNLKESAKEFFLQNVYDIHRTDKWEAFKLTNPILCSELHNYVVGKLFFNGTSEKACGYDPTFSAMQH